MLRFVLYIFVVPFVLWSLESINISGIFKKNRYYQARFVYLIFALSLSYLLVNFFMDFFTTTLLV